MTTKCSERPARWIGLLSPVLNHDFIVTSAPFTSNIFMSWTGRRLRTLMEILFPGVWSKKEKCLKLACMQNSY